MTAGHPVPALLALAAALLLWLPASAASRVRVQDLVAAPDRSPPSGFPSAVGQHAGSGDPPGRRRRWVQAGAAGVGVFLLLGVGTGGVLGGAGVAVLAERLMRRPGGAPADDGVGDLPVACDLLAVCLAAGTPIGAAVAAVASSVSGPLGHELGQVGALYRLGAAPRQAWSGVPPGMAPLARVLVRAGESGSAVVPALQRLASDQRVAQRSAVEAAVRRAGVWVLAPLGVCFLPAFLCLGVVPMVLGIAADVFS